MDELFDKNGQIDFDKLNPLERELYLKALDNVASAEVTLEDWKNYISHMREAVESALVDEQEYIWSSIFPFFKRKNPKVVELKARLKNYLIFEKFLSKKEYAQKALQEYNKRLGMK